MFASGQSREPRDDADAFAHSKNTCITRGLPIHIDKTNFTDVRAFILTC
jgi:hypothetical protein